MADATNQMNNSYQASLYTYLLVGRRQKVHPANVGIYGESVVNACAEIWSLSELHLVPNKQKLAAWFRRCRQQRMNCLAIRAVTGESLSVCSKTTALKQFKKQQVLSRVQYCVYFMYTVQRKSKFIYRYIHIKCNSKYRCKDKHKYIIIIN